MSPPMLDRPENNIQNNLRKLRDKDLREWRNSGVNDSITKLNVISLVGKESYQYLTLAERTKRSLESNNNGDRWQKRYSHCEAGGWWCSGIDVLTGMPATWGQFKPDRPYSIAKKKGFSKSKIIKYESSPRVSTEIYALRVTAEIWQRIAAVNNVPIPSRVEIDETTGNAPQFWNWVLNNPSIPVTITEGAKKAGALLSLGLVAIALPGIWNGRRQRKDIFGNKIGSDYPIEQLKVFATKGREINFCFDNDRKASTKKQVRSAIVKTGKLFVKRGCTVKVIEWQYPEKGVDDLIVARKEAVFREIYARRKPLSAFQLLDVLDLSRFVSLSVSDRYLKSTLMPPKDAKIIGIKSAKNTGKSTWLASQVERAISAGKKVIAISHRRQLARSLANRFKISYIEEMDRLNLGEVKSLALCIDSLHADSQARFDPEDWEDAIVIIDEAEQVFWHALNSTTLQNKRVKILENLEDLIKITLATGGKIYLTDADLSPIAIKYVQNLANFPLKTWVVENLYCPNQGKRKLYSYQGTDPRNLVAALTCAIASGKKVLVHTSGQKAKSKWGTINLEKFLQQKCCDLGKSISILRIDSESIGQREHPAYNCPQSLDRVISQYDVVLASPTLETGVSIDLKGHFDSVWCIAWGVQSVDSVCQAIARLRENVPRHIWARNVGINAIGNGSIEIKKLLASTHQQTRANIACLEAAGVKDFSDLNWEWENHHLRVWALRAAIVNAGMHSYRQSIIEKLSAEGYQIFNLDRDPIDGLKLKQEIDRSKEDIYQKYCRDVARSELLDRDEFDSLQKKRSLTQQERYSLLKTDLANRYCISVTPELVAKDDRGWYSQLLLHYYLTRGKQFLKRRDTSQLFQLTESINKAFKPDINLQQLSLKVNGLKILEIERFLDSERQFTNLSLTDWYSKIANPLTLSQIKTVYGVSINPEKTSAIAAANKLLRQMDLKLIHSPTLSARDRVYVLISADRDNRQLIFAQWRDRDLSRITFSQSIADK